MDHSINTCKLVVEINSFKLLPLGGIDSLTLIL